MPTLSTMPIEEQQAAHKKTGATSVVSPVIRSCRFRVLG